MRVHSSRPRTNGKFPIGCAMCSTDPALGSRVSRQHHKRCILLPAFSCHDTLQYDHGNALGPYLLHRVWTWRRDSTLADPCVLPVLNAWHGIYRPGRYRSRWSCSHQSLVRAVLENLPCTYYCTSTFVAHPITSTRLFLPPPRFQFTLVNLHTPLASVLSIPSPSSTASLIPEMAPRRTHTRQQSKAVTYCDSIHTIVISPRSSSFYPGDGMLDVLEIPTQTNSRKLGPFGRVLKVLAACSRKPQPPRKEKSARRTSAPKMSVQETAAMRHLLAPPPPPPKDVPGSQSSLLYTPQPSTASLPRSSTPSSFQMGSISSRASTTSSYHTGTALCPPPRHMSASQLYASRYA